LKTEYQFKDNLPFLCSFSHLSFLFLTGCTLSTTFSLRLLFLLTLTSIQIFSINSPSSFTLNNLPFYHYFFLPWLPYSVTGNTHLSRSSTLSSLGHHFLDITFCLETINLSSPPRTLVDPTIEALLSLLACSFHPPSRLPRPSRTLPSSNIYTLLPLYLCGDKNTPSRLLLSQIHTPSSC